MLRISRTAVRPPLPESNTPMGRRSMETLLIAVNFGILLICS